MMNLHSERLKKLFAYLASTELALFLFLGISLVALPGTFFENRTLYSSPLFLLLFWGFGVNLLLCTFRRFSTISWPVRIIHSGVILTMAGCLLTRTGFVATVNVYEGTGVDKVYRWDLKQDVSIGADIVVKKITLDHYPMPLKIGVLKGGKKYGLHQLKTQESFTVDAYRVVVGKPVWPAEELILSVYDGDRLVGTYNTRTAVNTFPPAFPFDFKLVAFQAPVIRRQWADIMLTREMQSVAVGVSEVNNPFKWNGMFFYMTAASVDKEGKPFAGIQVVRDPGRPVVFSGFTVVAIGAVWAFARRFYMKRQSI